MNTLNPKAKVILPFLILSVLAFSSEVFALELDWPSSPSGLDLNDLTAGSELPEMIAYFYEWGIAISGLAAFFALVLAGFQYLTSAGAPAKMADARDRISSAIMGLLLLLASFLILNVINPDLTTLTVPEINPPSGTLESATATIEALLKGCEKAIVYSKENYDDDGDSRVVLAGDNEELPWPAKSVEIIGACRLELYDKIGCPGPMKPMTILHASYPDLSILYLENPVWCVYNIEEGSGAPSCETDCSLCGSSNCLTSPAGCWWSDMWWECLDSDEVTCDMDCKRCTTEGECWLSMAGCRWELGECVPEHFF